MKKLEVKIKKQKYLSYMRGIVKTEIIRRAKKQSQKKFLLVMNY